VARQPTFMFDPYGLSSGAIDPFRERASIFDESSGSPSQRLGPAHLFASVIEEFSRRKGIGVTPQAKIILISIALELTVTRNIGSVANPKRADDIRFLAVATRIQRMVVDDDLAWISDVLRMNEKGNLLYTPQHYGSGAGFLDPPRRYRGVSVAIDATTVIAWLPDFVKGIECPCWPV
jgi:hypothetical protein